MQEAITHFLYHEARLLDERQFNDWLDLWSDPLLYWIPSTLQDCDPNKYVSFLYDDRELLEERIKRLESPYCYAQDPPSRTLHQISNITYQEKDAVVTVQSNLVLYEFKPNHQPRIYPLNVFPAFVEHDLTQGDQGLKINQKKVRLLNSDGLITNLTFLI